MSSLDDFPNRKNSFDFNRTTMMFSSATYDNIFDQLNEIVSTKQTITYTIMDQIFTNNNRNTTIRNSNNDNMQPTISHPTNSNADNVFESKIIIPLYVIIFVLAVVGNTLVLVTLIRNKRMRTVTNVYLLNLVSKASLFAEL